MSLLEQQRVLSQLWFAISSNLRKAIINQIESRKFHKFCRKRVKAPPEPYQPRSGQKLRPSCFPFIKYKLATGDTEGPISRIIQLEAIDFKTWVIPAPQNEMLDGGLQAITC